MQVEHEAILAFNCPVNEGTSSRGISHGLLRWCLWRKMEAKWILSWQVMKGGVRVARSLLFVRVARSLARSCSFVWPTCFVFHWKNMTISTCSGSDGLVYRLSFSLRLLFTNWLERVTQRSCSKGCFWKITNLTRLCERVVFFWEVEHARKAFLNAPKSVATGLLAIFWWNTK